MNQSLIVSVFVSGKFYSGEVKVRADLSKLRFLFLNLLPF
jgi:hypothetical protein